MYQTEHLQEKWQPVLQHPDLPEIKDAYRRAVTTVILENQEKAMREDSEFLSEATPANRTGSGISNWDPILISLVRRAMPSLIAYDVCGVQPMTGPTGLIFAMKARYTSQLGTEALFNAADTDFAGSGTHAGADPFESGSANTAVQTAYTTGAGDTTATDVVEEVVACADDCQKACCLGCQATEGKTACLADHSCCAAHKAEADYEYEDAEEADTHKDMIMKDMIMKDMITNKE